MKNFQDIPGHFEKLFQIIEDKIKQAKKEVILFTTIMECIQGYQKQLEERNKEVNTLKRTLINSARKKRTIPDIDTLLNSYRRNNGS
jgi:ATP-dependent Clp protease ATP-binding subunit ClpA